MSTIDSQVTIGSRWQMTPDRTMDPPRIYEVIAQTAPTWWLGAGGKCWGGQEGVVIPWAERPDTTLLSEMRVGTWFRDINGNLWRVKRRAGGLIHVVDEQGDETVFGAFASGIRQDGAA